MSYPPGRPGSTDPTRQGPGAGPPPGSPPAPPSGAYPTSSPPSPSGPPPGYAGRDVGPPPVGGAPGPGPAGAGPPPGQPQPVLSAPPPRPRRAGRIVGRALVVLVVIGALAATTAWGFANRSSAERWKDRSETSDARLRDSLDRVETTGTELEDARERLRDLAAEKAGETDLNRILADIVTQAPEVTEAMRDCQRETTDLANDIIAAFGDPEPDLAAFEERTDEVNAICEDALGAATALEESIDELGL